MCHQFKELFRTEKPFGMRDQRGCGGTARPFAPNSTSLLPLWVDLRLRAYWRFAITAAIT